MMKAFEGTLVQTTTITVYADTAEEASDYIMDMYLNGDACAEMSDATVADVHVIDLTNDGEQDEVE